MNTTIANPAFFSDPFKAEKATSQPPAAMSLNKMLNGTPSQLPTPDTSPASAPSHDMTKTSPPLSPRESVGSPKDFRLFSPSTRPASTTPLFRSKDSQDKSTTLPSTPLLYRLADNEIKVTLQTKPSLDSVRLPPIQTKEPHLGFDIVSRTSDPSRPKASQTVVLHDRSWELAASNHKRYLKDLRDFNNQYVYRSGNNDALDALADIAASRRVEFDVKGASRSALKPRVGETRKRKAVREPTTDGAQRDAAIRQSRGRRKQRDHGDDSDVSVKKQRVRAEPKTKDKPNHFTEVPDHAPDFHVMNDEAVARFLRDSDIRNSIDLATDPDAHLLHDKELQFAAAHRLDCNKYLINKRLIFQAKVNALVAGKAFSKTHAQQAGIIDVNKSSKAWEFYNHAGWFKASLFDEEVEKVKRQRAQHPIEKTAMIADI